MIIWKEMRNILLISPECWGALKVSKHHYAEILSRRDNVYFLNPPSKVFKCHKVNDNLKVLDYKPLLHGLRFMPKAVAAILIAIEIERIERLAGIRFQLIWNFEFSRFFNLSRVKQITSILHIVDYDLITNTPKRVILQAIQTYKYSVGISNSICDFLKQYGGFPLKIGHGYRIPAKYEVSGIKGEYRLNVGYVGNLLIKYIDWDMINSLIKKNPDLGFHFIGPTSYSNLGPEYSEQKEKVKKIQNYENTYFYGVIESELIHAYLLQFDILIITYLSDSYPKELSNPHKVLEYLGSGKVIVSTRMAEYENLVQNELIAMSKNNMSFTDLFNSVVKEIETWNNHNKRLQRIAFAKNNVYEKQISRIISWISRNGEE